MKVLPQCYVSVPHTGLVPEGPEEGAESPELELQTTVSYCV